MEWCVWFSHFNCVIVAMYNESKALKEREREWNIMNFPLIAVFPKYFFISTFTYHLRSIFYSNDKKRCAQT